MKNLLLITLLFGMFNVNLSAQTVFYSETFESLTDASSGGWTLGVDAGSSTTRNRWSMLSGGTGVFAPITGSKSLRVARANGTLNYNATNACDIQAVKQIVATGYSSISLEFKYKCNGEWDSWFGDIYDAGQVGYSTNGTTVTWFTAGGIYSDGIYNDVTTTTTQTYTLPSSLNNSTFYIHFRWFNDGSDSYDPAFMIDDVKVRGTYTSPLPVEFISFSGENNQGVNFLKWEIASEINSDYYSVQRSAETDEWTSIGEVRCRGLKEYELSDKNPGSGINYYRLSQTDFNGETNVLSLISVMNKEKTVISIVDASGRFVSEDSKGFLFIIYSDGTVEHKIN